MNDFFLNSFLENFELCQYSSPMWTQRSENHHETDLLSFAQI